MMSRIKSFGRDLYTYMRLQAEALVERRHGG
jgi:hypothetical protein